MRRFHVILPAYNEAENIERCISTIQAAIGGRDIPITLVDNQSTDDTVERARKLGTEVLTFPEKLTIAELRNRGAAHAESEFLLFIDSDMQVPADWISRIEEVLSETDADVFGFVVDAPVSAPWYSRIWHLRTKARREKLMEIDFLPGHNISVRRSFFEKVGGFSTDFRTSEDKDFVMRLKAASAKVYSIPSIGIIHWGYEKTFKEWTRKEFWRQSSHLDMLSSHGISARLLRFPLTAVLHVIGLVMLVIALASSAWLTSLAIALVLAAPSLAQTLNNRISRSSPSRILQFSSLYFARFNIAGVAVISELFRRRKQT